MNVLTLDVAEVTHTLHERIRDAELTHRSLWASGPNEGHAVNLFCPQHSPGVLAESGASSALDDMFAGAR